MSGELPPPPVGGQWQNWAERLNSFLARTRDKLRYLTTLDRASDDGILMWDRSIDHPVVSLDGEWVPLGYGANDPDQGYGYGAFLDFTDQTCAATETPTAITWGTTVYSNGVAVGSPTSRIVFTNAGKYYIPVSYTHLRAHET